MPKGQVLEHQVAVRADEPENPDGDRLDEAQHGKHRAWKGPAVKRPRTDEFSEGTRCHGDHLR